jgi:hypothetical protein
VDGVLVICVAEILDFDDEPRIRNTKHHTLYSMITTSSSITTADTRGKHIINTQAVTRFVLLSASSLEPEVRRELLLRRVYYCCGDDTLPETIINLMHT